MGDIEWITEPAEPERSVTPSVEMTLPSPPKSESKEQTYQPVVVSSPIQKEEHRPVEAVSPRPTKATSPPRPPKDDKFVHYDFRSLPSSEARSPPEVKSPPATEPNRPSEAVKLPVSDSVAPKAYDIPESVAAKIPEDVDARIPTEVSQESSKQPENLTKTTTSDTSSPVAAKRQESSRYRSPSSDGKSRSQTPKSSEVKYNFPTRFVVSDVEARALRELEDDIPSRLSSLRIYDNTYAKAMKDSEDALEVSSRRSKPSELLSRRNEATEEPPQQIEASGVRQKTPDSDAEEMARMKTQKVKDDNGFTYYTCRFCGITFNYITTLKSHERKHGVEKPFVCAKCGEAFHYDCELQYHVKSHVDQKGYKCDCGRTFYQYTELLNHSHPDDPTPIYSQAVNQPGEDEQAARVKPFSKIPENYFPTPEFAEKGYEPKYQVRQYNEVRTHPYICQYCSKSYPDSRQLAYHMYSHRGERTFNPRASRYLMCRNENSYISPGVWLDK
ncbi:unnamed protein product [Bursaphelenchus okinawaensis]|uniref:Zinc finger protein unc-98 n=1 Tax=Bursaphelenchus okinawaensis TaxID=465554 RepID=A0A811LN19_9BILA|nr:unnamed protein product [Bursaphelenchus okinawaensis]CAG9126779.1 unnamed protein product [Bursaphelenchus okinawaensis]